MLSNNKLRNPNCKTIDRRSLRMLSILLLVAIWSNVLGQTRLPVKWFKPSLSSVGSVVNSPNGKLQAISGSASVEVVDPSTGKVFQSLFTSIEQVQGLAFLPDNATLAVWGTNPMLTGYGHIELWDVNAGKLIRETNILQPLGSVVVTPDGKQLLLGTATSEVIVLNASTLDRLPGFRAMFRNSTSVLALAPDGGTLAIGGNSGLISEIELWDLKSQKFLTTLNVTQPIQWTTTSGAFALAFSQDGNTLIDAVYLSTQTFSGTQTSSNIQLWHLSRNGNPMMTASVRTCDYLTGLSVSPDQKSIGVTGYNLVYTSGNKIISGTSGYAAILDASSALTMGVFNIASVECGSIWFSPDGKSVSLNAFTDSKSLVDTFSFPGLNLITSHNLSGENYTNTSASPDGKRIANLGSTVTIWDADNGNELLSLPTELQGPVSFLQWIPGTSNLMVAGTGPQNRNPSNLIEIWNGSTGAQLGKFNSGAPYGIDCAALTSDGTTLVTSGQYYPPLTYTRASLVEVWDLASKAKKKTLGLGNFVAQRMTVSPDMSTIAFYGAINELAHSDAPIIEIVDLKSGTLLQSLSVSVYPVNCLTYSPDGTRIYCGGGNTVVTTDGTAYLQCWDAHSGRQVTIPAPLPGSAPIQSIAFTTKPRDLLIGTAQELQLIDLYGLTAPSYFSLPGVASIGSVLDGTALAIGGVNGGFEVVQSPSLDNTPTQVGSLSINSSVIKGGQSATGIITLSRPALMNGVIVPITSNDPDIVVPRFVSFAPGAAKASFPITTWATVKPIYGAITARAGISKTSASITVTTNPPLISSLSLISGVIQGYGQVIATVNLSVAAPPGGVNITVSSNDPNIMVPNTVTIPQGEWTANFAIRASWVSSVVHGSVTIQLGTSSKSVPIEIDP